MSGDLRGVKVLFPPPFFLFLLSYSPPKERPKDANDALKMGWDLKKMIEAAQHIPHAKIATSRDYEAAILRELQDPRAAGFSFFSFLFSFFSFLIS